MSKSSRILGVTAVLLLGAMILIGRHERSSWVTKENRGIAAVRQAVGARLKSPEGFRTSLHFTCLLYPRDGHAFGLELCFAPSGAIIEAIRRTPGLDPKIWTLRAVPGAATVRENPVLIARILDRLGAQTGTAIKVGQLDLGPEAPVQP